MQQQKKALKKNSRTEEYNDCTEEFQCFNNNLTKQKKE